MSDARRMVLMLLGIAVAVSGMALSVASFVFYLRGEFQAAYRALAVGYAAAVMGIKIGNRGAKQ